MSNILEKDEEKTPEVVLEAGDTTPPPNASPPPYVSPNNLYPTISNNAS